MAERKKLNDSEIQESLSELSGWRIENGKLHKSFQFDSFVDAFGFMTKSALVAEAMNHHPDIFMHSWNKVKISISTHDKGGVTLKDFDLANKIQELQ